MRNKCLKKFNNYTLDDVTERFFISLEALVPVGIVIQRNWSNLIFFVDFVSV